MTERRKKKQNKTRKPPQQQSFYALRGDVESSKASFDRASKNTISTLTMLHLSMSTQHDFQDSTHILILHFKRGL